MTRGPIYTPMTPIFSTGPDKVAASVAWEWLRKEQKWGQFGDWDGIMYIGILSPFFWPGMLSETPQMYTN